MIFFSVSYATLKNFYGIGSWLKSCKQKVGPFLLLKFTHILELKCDFLEKFKDFESTTQPARKSSFDDDGKLRNKGGEVIIA